MTTTQYSTVWEHTSDATFRLWGDALSTAMQTTGLTQTADTGQINWTTVTRPGANTAGGYEIFRFADTLQATAPIFIKIEYGTGGAATIPMIWVTVGTGTNGSGTITGTASARITVGTSTSITSTSTPYNTQICHIAGFLGASIKQNSHASTKNHFAFFIGRTCDDTGAETADGFYILYFNGASSAPVIQSVSFLTSIAYTANTQSCLVPGNVSASLVGADIQVYKHYTITPRVRPILHLITIIISEVGSGTTVSIAMVGTTAGTYLSLGSFFNAATSNANLNTGLGFLWE